ncbi:unnamed protein product [Spirodela intermedia]|uniref:Uncharacterized protein n=1 Tax=Spirodela intermedia TaxID=51605 RepID=A0A7I8IEQ9_SPIIN|nr:unnamed protein product [Spirodela intermedia]CAA6655865.1 unnamed protein product [Spirodela intermedia]
MPSSSISSKRAVDYSAFELTDSNGPASSAFDCPLSLTLAAAMAIDSDSLPRMLKWCAGVACLRGGASLHARAVKGGFEASTSTANSPGELLRQSMGTTKDSVSWNAMLHGFLSGGAAREEGLALFTAARAAGSELNLSNLVLALQACWKLGATLEALVIHGLVVRNGASSHLPIQNSLLCSYAKSRDMGSAQQMFDEIPHRDMISWSALIGGYAQCGEPEAGLRWFQEMVSSRSAEPDGVTLVNVLQACSCLEDAEPGEMIHAHAIRRGFQHDVFLGNSLISMYSKCLALGSARRAFAEVHRKNVVSWNSLLSGLVHGELHSEALSLFDSMRRAGFAEDEVTLVSLLHTCRSHQHGVRCRSIHSVATRRGFESNMVVVNTILDAYCKCGLVGLASRLFGAMNDRNLISWSTMMMGFSDSGQPDEAVSLFGDMMLADVRPNSVILLSILQACSALVEIKLLRSIHGVAFRNGLTGELAVGTALLDAYAKCGEIESSSNAMIAALGVNGRPRETLALFREMEFRGVKPNEVTVLSLLSACSHGGMVEEGLSCFGDVFSRYSLSPSPEHYSCLVDMLARAGDVGGAWKVIEELPVGLTVGAAAWGSLLSACRSHGHWELGERALSRVVELEQSEASGYLLASNMYAMGGEKRASARMRMMVKERGLRVAPGFSSVSLDRRLHRFVAGDDSHPRSVEIRSTVGHLHLCMRASSDEKAVD